MFEGDIREYFLHWRVILTVTTHIKIYFKHVDLQYVCVKMLQLGVSPINSFDAFFLKHGAEYKFRITARNRYGWGESVTTTETITIGSASDFPPDIVKDLPGPVKALQGDSITLECEVRNRPFHCWGHVWTFDIWLQSEFVLLQYTCFILAVELCAKITSSSLIHLLLQPSDKLWTTRENYVRRVLV